MSDEFQEFPTMQSMTTMNLPGFEQFFAQKTQVKDSSFDPHLLMVKKKLTDAGVTVDNTPKREWPEKDIQALEDFCLKYGIVGFNCGKMSPIAALAMLKQKLGVIEPTENRVTYSDAMNKKTLLKG